MINTYFSIPYKAAVEFLTGLSEKDKKKVYEKYNITEPVTKNNKLYTQEEQIAEFISDTDLINLGYTDTLGDESADIDEYDEELDNIYYSASDILAILEDYCDEDEISDLLKEYNVPDIEELSVVILDEALNNILKSKNILKDNQDVNDVLVNESLDVKEKESCMDDSYFDDYHEEYDFLEDLPSDLKFHLYSTEEDPYLFSFDNEADGMYFMESLDPNLVSECIPLPEKSNDKEFVIKVVPNTYKISEEVVINDKLNPLLFDEEHNLKPEVKEQLIDYIFNFINENKDFDVDYSDIVLVGSNAGYLYRPDSDIDIHFISTKPLDEDIFEQLRDKFSLYQAENPLTIGDHHVEMNIEDGYNMIMNNKNPRRYSLLDDVWVDDSDKNEVYTESDLSAVDGYEDIVKNYVSEIDDIVGADEYSDALALKKEIRQNRSDDLKNFGSLSMGNVVFKELRENGAYGKLRNYIKSKEKVG